MNIGLVDQRHLTLCGQLSLIHILEIVVEPGATTNDVATKLRAEGIIRQPLLFSYLVRSQELDGKLQAGRYLLRPNMTMAEIISALQNSRVEEIQVTIVEGSRLEEIAEQVGALGLLSVTEEGFLKTARNGCLLYTSRCV